MAVIKELQLRISAAVNEYIKDNDNIDVHGLSYDKDGIESGYDYNEFYLHSISDVTFSVHSVDEISDNISIVTLSCKADISADCYYLGKADSLLGISLCPLCAHCRCADRALLLPAGRDAGAEAVFLHR